MKTDQNSFILLGMEKKTSTNDQVHASIVTGICGSSENLIYLLTGVLRHPVIERLLEESLVLNTFDSLVNLIGKETNQKENK